MKWWTRAKVWLRLIAYRWSANSAEIEYLRRRRFRGGSVLDVGAHHGASSYWLHNRFKDGTRVVAFEPQPELADELIELKRSLRLNRLEVEAVGLSSRSGSLKMRRSRVDWGSATVDDFALHDADAEVFDVPVTTIDEYLEVHPALRPVRLIKCDVEAHETEVLAGAKRTLSQDRPEILVEWSTPRRSYRERMFRLAQELGYAIFQFERGRLQPCTSPERRSPPSWELGGKYLLLPCGRPGPAI